MHTTSTSWEHFGTKKSSFVCGTRHGTGPSLSRQDGGPIPKELLSKLLASRRANAGGFNLRQIVLATFDQEAHTRGATDTQQLFSDTYDAVLGIRPIPGTNMTASWGHMVGYDAQYYGYLVSTACPLIQNVPTTTTKTYTRVFFFWDILCQTRFILTVLSLSLSLSLLIAPSHQWSEVFSFDMFETRFRAEGLLSPKVGLDYRRKILEPGGSRDANRLLRDFLGRDPTEEAFLRAKGLKA